MLCRKRWVGKALQILATRIIWCTWAPMLVALLIQKIMTLPNLQHLDPFTLSSRQPETCSQTSHPLVAMQRLNSFSTSLLKPSKCTRLPRDEFVHSVFICQGEFAMHHKIHDTYWQTKEPAEVCAKAFLGCQNVCEQNMHTNTQYMYKKHINSPIL